MARKSLIESLLRGCLFRPLIVGDVSYQTSLSAGFDLSSTHPFELAPGERRAVHTGCRIIPSYFGLFELQIRPRSGLALKHGITVLNSPGTVDMDYKDEIKAILINHSAETVRIEVGDRIAQGVISRVYRAAGASVLNKEREGGFGSTGGKSE